MKQKVFSRLIVWIGVFLIGKHALAGPNDFTLTLGIDPFSTFGETYDQIWLDIEETPASFRSTAH